MFFCFWRTSALFLEEFSFLRILRELSRMARRTYRNFLEFSSLLLNSFAYSHLPCLLVNPIPIRRHPSAREVQAFIERAHGLNQCPRYGGTFFCFWRTSALFLEEISSMKILREFSRVARRTWRKFLENS